MQIEPPPTPTFIKSAPASAKYKNPSLSTTFPAPIFTESPYFFFLFSKLQIHWHRLIRQYYE